MLDTGMTKFVEGLQAPLSIHLELEEASNDVDALPTRWKKVADHTIMAGELAWSLETLTPRAKE